MKMGRNKVFFDEYSLILLLVKTGGSYGLYYS